jgi:hypothetical protein
MASRRLSSGTAVAIVVGAIVVGWLAYIQFFNDERAIRRRMNDVAAALSTSREGTDLARLSRVMQLRRFLAEDVHAVDQGALELRSRDEVLAVAARWATLDGGLSADFIDLTVSVDPGGETAESQFTAQISTGDPENTDAHTEVRDTTVALAKRGGEWVITAVDARRP